ncbi:MAG: hypothetical protein R2911_23540 [Caldilineaceae bacterium]
MTVTGAVCGQICGRWFRPDRNCRRQRKPVGGKERRRILYKAGKNVTIGAANSGTLQILNKNQDASGDTLILGRTEGSHLRLGYHGSYSWVQSQSANAQPPAPLAINPLGGNVGVGTVDPKARCTLRAATWL